MKEISKDAYWSIRKYIRENPEMIGVTKNYAEILSDNRSREKHYEIIEDINPSRWMMEDEIEVRCEAAKMTPYITNKNKLNEEADKVKKDLDFLTAYDDVFDRDLSKNITKFILALKN
ncbi:MAG: hypothetical protein ACP5NZ_04655 [Nanobdellota archaeon]